MLGELCCYRTKEGKCDYNKPGDCLDALNQYQHSFIDPLYMLLSNFTNVPVVIILGIVCLISLISYYFTKLSFHFSAKF